MAHVTVDMSEIEKLGDELDRFAHKAVPYATRNALNTTAFEGRKVWQKAMGREFTLRNKYVQKSIRVEKAQLRPRAAMMESAIGSVFPGLDKQEEGGVIRGRGGASKPIPTRVAAGQSMGSGERTRTVRAPNKLSAIRLAKGGRRGQSKRQRNAISIRRAIKAGRKFAAIEARNGKAIVKLTGRKRVRARMVWDVSRKTVHVPAAPTLQRTLKIMERRMPSIMLDALREQARRHRILGY